MTASSSARESHEGRGGWKLSDEVLAWATGQELSLAASARAIRTHTFHLRSAGWQEPSSGESR